MGRTAGTASREGHILLEEVSPKPGKGPACHAELPVGGHCTPGGEGEMRGGAEQGPEHAGLLALERIWVLVLRAVRKHRGVILDAVPPP